jgi:hypothetical protein
MSKITKLTNNILLFTELKVDIKKVFEQLKNAEWKIWGRANNDPNQKIGELFFIKDNKVLFDEIASTAQRCTELYLLDQDLEVDACYFHPESIYIRKWDFPMRGMEAHSDHTFDDNGNHKKVDFTILGYLNEDYEGGFLEFPEYSIRIKPPSGSVIIFPAEELHAVTDLLNGNRIMWSTFIYKK